MGAPLFSAPGCGEREGLGVSVGLGTGLSSGVSVGVGDAFLRFDFVLGVAVGDGVGEIFFRFGVAVGEGLGVGFFVERFRCLRGTGVGVAKIFLIFVPNESSAAFATSNAPNKSAKIKSSPTNLRNTAAPKAAKHWRTPKCGRARKLTFRACVLECGGAPPLFMLYSSRSRA